MTDGSGHAGVHRPDRDKRVHDAERFLRDRETEAVAMIALWGRSRTPDAPDELAHWRAVLARVRRELTRLEDERSAL
jgi:hypothetical protein